MTQIYSYQKVETPHTVICMSLPFAEGDEARHCTELCTLDGVTYVAVPATVALPQQPAEITVELASLTPEIKAAIKAASPHVALIAERMVQRIRAAYTIDDEMFFARVGVGAATGMYEPTSGELAEMQAFGNFVESVREWGRSERAKLGL